MSVAQEPDAPAPESALTEEAGVTLRLVDVEVVFDWGDYVPRLGPTDFIVRQGLEVQQIESVDEICACGGGSFDLGDWTVRFGRITGDMATACECFYRIGLEPYEGRFKQLEPHVVLAERSIPASLRQLTEIDHWWREGRAVLADPATAADIPLAVAIVPLRVSDGRWDVSVQVALDPAHLELRRVDGKLTGGWEVGVLLVGRDSRRVWEMLGVSELRRRGKKPIAASVLHRRTISGLPPGRYEMRSFVRDRETKTFGGGRAAITLVDPLPRTLTGPVMMRSESDYLATELPLRRQGNASTEVQSGVIETGILPVGGPRVAVGQAVEFMTWACFTDKDAVFDLDSTVVGDDEVLIRFGGGRISRAGDCAVFGNTLEAGKLGAGRYTYRVAWEREGQEPIDAQIAFEIHPDKE